MARGWFARRVLPLLVGLGSLGTLGSAPPSGGVGVARDIPYANPGGWGLTLDVYRLPGDERLPAVIALHGGAWRGGDKSAWSAGATQLAGSGFVVFVPDYRLTSVPGITIGSQRADLARVVDWVVAHAADHGADPRRIGLLGSSAGGHLALLSAYRDMLPSGPVRAVAAWSPAVNLTALATGELRTMIRQAVGCRLADCPRRYRRASPLTFARTATTPTFVVSSEREIIPPDGIRRLASRLRRGGTVVERRLLDGHAHGLQYREVMLEPTAAFLHRHLSPSH